MTQDITTLSSPALVESYVRSFITADTDGSQRVNVAALSTWLAEQFSYLTTSGASPIAKQAQAQAIGDRLAGVVNREHWQFAPDYPSGGTSNTESVKARLIDLRTQMYHIVLKIGDNYRPIEAKFATVAKAMFNTIVLPTFPAGVRLIETTRAYIETFVTDWGEESAPSPVSALVTLDQNDSATVTCAAAPAGRHITARRLYRSATGTTQSAFRLQGEYPIAQTVVTDATLDEQLNDVCETFGWLEPPANLVNLTGMANGIMLAHDGDRTLYACEPYKPYAWPLKYTKPLAHKITGAVAVGQSAFIGTTGRPYLVSGSDSASLSEELISSNVPCVSARSMVAIGGSVLYASPDGLALYESGQVKIVTEGVIDRAAWAAYNPASMRASEFDGRYVAFFTRTDATRGALMFDYHSRSIAELDQAADAVFADQSGMYVLDGTAVLDVLPAAGTLRDGAWYSKPQHLARPQSFGWLQVQFSPKNTGPVSATVRTYGKGALVHTATLTSDEPVRHPAGRYSDWRVEIESSAIIESVGLASTTSELNTAP